MTYLVDYEIERMHLIEPLDTQRIQPSSIDLTLSNSFIIDDKVMILDEYDIQPLEFILGSTYEYIRLPGDISAEVCGCSTIGRNGLFIQNAGHVDAGFHGQITLELFNASKKQITLKAGQRICQMRFAEHMPCNKPYNGRYVGQVGATAGKGKE